MSLVLCGLALVGAQAEVAQPVEMRVQAREGAKLTRRIELSHDLQLAKMTMVVGGVEQLAQQRLGVKSRLQILMRDEVRQATTAGPSLVQRKLDDWLLEATLLTVTGGKEVATALEAQSPLTGTSVVHQRLADGSWGRHYDERESSEEFLARLDASADLAGFLPQAAVAIGAEWDVVPSLLNTALCPGGAVPMRFTKGEDNLYARQLGAGVGGPLHEVLLQATWEGTVRAKFVRIEQVEEAPHAVIELRVEVQAKADQTQFANENLGKYDRLDGRHVQSSTTQLALDGRGELRYSLKDGLVRSLTLDTKERVSSAVRGVRNDKDDLQQTLELAGTLKLAWTITPVKPRKQPSK